MRDGSTPHGPDRSAWNGLVDAHVHFHAHYDEHRFLRSAMQNFERAAQRLIPGEPWMGVLVMTECAGDAYFHSLAERVGTGISDDLRIEATDEAYSVRIVSLARTPPMAVIAGRQIQSREGIEVLTFPALDQIPDGRPVRDVLDALAERGAICMIPWGFGKWWFGRGRTIRNLPRTPRPVLHLADTGHRPAWAPLPRLLRLERAAGRSWLTGSDPLPLAGEEGRAGSSCFLVSPVHPSRPAGTLRDALADQEVRPARLEQRPGPAAFAWRQGAMQLRKRFSR